MEGMVVSNLLVWHAMKDVVIARFGIASSLVVGAIGCSEAPRTVAPENRPPAASDALFAVDEDAAVSGVLIARDPDGDALELSIVAAPGAGTVTLEGNRFVYKPNPNFHGDDELVFVASDGELASDEAHVRFRVGSIDDVPQLGVNAFSGPAGFRIAGQLVATDVDGDTMTFAAATPQSGSFIEFDGATGKFVFEPLPSFGGTEVVPLTVSANGETTTGTMTLKGARVLFGGSWLASDVRIDNNTCDNFTLPLEYGPPTSITISPHTITCPNGLTVMNNALQLALDGVSPSGVHATQDLSLGGATIHVDLTIQPMPATPQMYRYVEAISGAFTEVTSATLKRP
jgi:Bacterial Ig domain